jgi:hypothetical protein
MRGVLVVDCFEVASGVWRGGDGSLRVGALGRAVTNGFQADVGAEFRHFWYGWPYGLHGKPEDE